MLNKIAKFLSYYSIFVALITAITSLVYANMFITCPAYNDGDFDKCLNPIYFASFALFEMIINLILFHYCKKFNRVDYLVPIFLLKRKSEEYRQSLNHAKFEEDTSEKNGNIDTSNDVKPKYCSTCRIIVPYRCHHCSLCNTCIVNRDHHCHMTAGCVGFANQRYFIVFLFWAAINSALGFSYLVRYLNRFYIAFLPLGFVEYFMMPVAAYKWLYVGSCTTLTFVLVFLFFIGYLVTGFAAVYCTSQSYMVLNNLKSRDIWKNPSERQEKRWISYRQHLREVFGPFWYLNFILPMPFVNELDENLQHFVNECHKDKIN